MKQLEDVLEMLDVAVKEKQFTCQTFLSRLQNKTLPEIEYKVNVLECMGFFKLVDVEPDYTYKLIPSVKPKVKQLLNLYNQ